MKCRHASKSELDRVSALLAREFNNDPIHKVVFADRDNRIDILRSFFRIYVDLSLKYGGTLLAENDAGALVYFRPEMLHMTNEEHVIIDSQLREVCGLDYAAVVAYLNGLDHYHPQNPPHYYISLLAVQKSYRGGSTVSDLFNGLNAILDKAQLPCYAECTRVSTQILIRRWGYHDTGSPLQIEGFPELFPVWREPQ